MTNIVRIPTEHAGLAMLPKSYDTHWVASRKAQVVQAVQALGGLIGIAMTIYGRSRATTKLERREITLQL